MTKLIIKATLCALLTVLMTSASASYPLPKIAPPQDDLKTSAQSGSTETGRWQELLFTMEEMNHVEGRHYKEQLKQLALTNQLDDDEEVRGRVSRIFYQILNTMNQEQLGLYKSRLWPWEIHTSSHKDIEGMSQAGGRILIGSAFVRKLELSDGELAMLIGHEVAHALAQHQRETASEVKYIKANPRVDLELVEELLQSDIPLQYQLARLSYDQEKEADHIGFRLAVEAGFDPKQLVSFYQKLQKVDEPTMGASGYPAVNTRLSLAMGLEKLWASRQAQP